MGPEGQGARESSPEPPEPREPQLGLVTVSPPQVVFAPSDRNSPAMRVKRYLGRRSVEV